MPNGLDFVQAMLVFGGALAALTGVGLVMADSAPPTQLVRVRRRLGERWRGLAATPWGRVPGCLAGWLTDRLEGLVRDGFGEADKRLAFGGLTIVLMLGVVPAAALLNALIGGRPFLFWYYLSLLAALGWLNFGGETGRARLLNGLAATYLGLSLFVVIPVYLVRSFTDATINNVFSHGVLKSLLVAVLWYVAAYGLGLALDTAIRWAGGDPGRSRPAGFARAFLAATPVAFVLTFLALLAGHFAVLDQSPERSWRVVLWATGLTALAFALTLKAMAWARGGGRLLAAHGFALLAAAGLSVVLAKAAYDVAAEPVAWADAAGVLLGRTAGRAGVYLDSRFWVSHLPFVPALAFVFATVAGFVARAAAGVVAAVAGGDGAAARPFLASAGTAGGLALLSWLAAAAV